MRESRHKKPIFTLDAIRKSKKEKGIPQGNLAVYVEF